MPDLLQGDSPVSSADADSDHGWCHGLDCGDGVDVGAQFASALLVSQDTESVSEGSAGIVVGISPSGD